MRRQWRAAALVGATALLAACSPGAFAPARSESSPSSTGSPPAGQVSPSPTEAAASVTVSAMGDMLPHDSVTADALLPDGTYDYGQFFDAARGIWSSSDLVYCNQEAPSGGAELGLSYYPAFNAPEEFAEGLQSAGCNTIGLGNNHTLDKGQEGIDRTRAVWDGLDPTLIAGANRSAEEQAQVPITEVNGLSVAFLSVVDLSNNPGNDFSLTWLDDPIVEQLMEQAESADATIVAVHWGDEYSPDVNDRQREQAQRLADLGADVILGTHPHVLQEAEWIERADGTEAFVYYSLGNALSTQMAVPRVVSAVAQFELVRAPGGGARVTDPSAVPIYMHFDLTPEQFASGDWVNRRNLQLYRMTDAAEPISRSAWRNELTVDSGIELVTDALGPDVTIRP